ncbi:MAG TPA: DUF1002 domain-containing protein [Candidatus Nosocomiicoccus stercorigallinarum]|nr:DUF1002 domain-containing protein [Candidatus Nosocomiicoccus stercorigallinarum]
MKKWLLILTSLLLTFSLSSKAFAASEWKESVTIYGAGLENSPDKEKMTELLGTKDSDVIDYVYGNDTEKYINYRYDDSILFSSIRIMEKNSGGLTIDIDETYGKITQISPQTYQNALITAGVTDADVTIAAPHDVTGESALTGIYKAYEVQGESLNPEYTKNAQDELNTISDITSENEGKDGYSESQLNKAITEIKITIINQINDGKDLTEDDVRQIVDEKLKDNGLQDVITDNQKNQIINIIIQIKNSGFFNEDSANKILDSSKDLLNQIKDSGAFKDAKEQAKNLGNDIKDFSQSEEGQGLIESIKSFFRSLFESIKNLFN